MEEFEAFTLASAASYLVEGQELYEASILLLCTRLSITPGGTYYSGNEGITDARVELFGNRAVYEIINDEKHPATIAIKRAIQAAFGQIYCLTSLTCRSVIADSAFADDWRSKLLDVIEGKIPLNQGVPIQDKPRYTWEYLFFRSPVEIAIAKSLDKRGVLFLPNCMSRLGLPSSRENREADFLVCCDSKWGILEINGDTYHTNSAKDHNRSRLFKIHGIRVFEAYEARRCIKEPDSVVQEFLELIRKNG
jgi:hypothetical protein